MTEGKDHFIWYNERKIVVVIFMSIAKEDLHKMIDQLSEDEWYSAYEFMCFLIYRSKRRLSWEEIDHLVPEGETLHDDEKKQFEAAEEYIALDKVIVECDL